MFSNNPGKVVGIIPARKGSKGIPAKNIKLVGGKSLIQWTVQAAQAAGTLDRILVTTDCSEIARAATLAGAEVPFLRPAELAQDDTPGIDPILHAVNWLAEHESYYPDIIMMLQPTSPLRHSDDIDAAVQLAVNQNADGVVSVTLVDHHPYWMKKLNDVGQMQDFIELVQPVMRRQNLPPLYVLNGSIYLAKRDVLLSHQSWYTNKTYAYVMPPERSLDIDTPWDLYLADLILRDRKDDETC